MIETREELERLVRQKFDHSILPGFKDGIEAHIQRKVSVAWERMRIMALDEECAYCCDKKAHPDICKEVYETPYRDEPDQRHYCCDDCYYNSDTDLTICDECGREMERVASDGMTTYIRVYHGSELCLRCFEVELHKCGVSRSDILQEKYPVIFEQMWENHPTDVGYTELHSGKRFTGHDEMLKEELLKLLDAGYRILVGLDRLSICGGEGYISIYYKDISDAEEKES